MCDRPVTSLPPSPKDHALRAQSPVSSQRGVAAVWAVLCGGVCSRSALLSPPIFLPCLSPLPLSEPGTSAPLENH